MTSHEWQQQIDSVTADIAVKEKRCEAIAHAKAAVIAIPDTKKLLVLEQEEAALPTLIESLKRRVPLLHQALEGALRAEAEARYQELEQLGEEAAARCAASSQAIRKAMQEVLNQITAAHSTWDANAMFASEGEYLRVRFELAPLRIALGERISAEERARFVRQFENLLHHAPNTQRWENLRREWREAKQRQEAQRRAAEAANRPNVPRYIHYHHDPGTPA